MMKSVLSKCFLPVRSFDIPLSISKHSAKSVCISPMHFSSSLQDFPVSWFIQSHTIWAWRLGIHVAVSPSSRWMKICKAVIPQCSLHSSQKCCNCSNVVSSLITTTPSLSGVLPRTIVTLPVFLFIRSRSLVCIFRPVFSLTIWAIWL